MVYHHGIVFLFYFSHTQLHMHLKSQAAHEHPVKENLTTLHSHQRSSQANADTLYTLFYDVHILNIPISDLREELEGLPFAVVFEISMDQPGKHAI